eukprot:1183177-Prorocentrum_minimum.AAC.1
MILRGPLKIGQRHPVLHVLNQPDLVGGHAKNIEPTIFGVARRMLVVQIRGRDAPESFAVNRTTSPGSAYFELAEGRAMYIVQAIIRVQNEVKCFQQKAAVLSLYLLFCRRLISPNQNGAAEAWWAHNPQVPGSKPGSDSAPFVTEAEKEKKYEDTLEGLRRDGWEPVLNK